MANPAALGSGGLTANGGVLDLNGNNLTISGHNALPSLNGQAGVITDSSTASTSTFTVNQATNSTFGGSLQTGPNGCALSLIKAGAGSLTLSGTFTTAAATVQNAGTLNIGGNLTAASLTAANSSTLMVSSQLSTPTVNVNAGATLAGNGTINVVGNGNSLFYGSSATSTFAGTVTGAGDIEVFNGTLVLAGSNNSYQGGTSLYSNGATTTTPSLRMGTANAIPYGPTAGDVYVYSPAVLDMAGFNTNINGLWGSGTIDNTTGSGMLVVGNNNVTSTFSGVLQNSGGTAAPLGLYKTGSGTFTLTGSNSYAGGTTMNNGMLVVADGPNTSNSVSALGSGMLTLNGGTLAAGAAGGSVAGLVQAGSAAHTISPGAGLPAGQYGTLNLNGGLYSNANTTLAFNLNLGTPIGGSTYGGDLINLGSSPLSVSGGSITFDGNNPTTTGDYRLFGGSNFGNPNLANFTLPVQSGESYALSTTADSGFIDLVVAPNTTPAVFTLSASAAAGLLHVNDSTTVTAAIANVGTGLADTVNYSGLGLNATGGSLSGPGLPLSGLALGQGSSASGGQTYTANVSGVITLTPTATTANGTSGAGVSAGTTSLATINVFSGNGTWTGTGAIALGSSIGSWGTGTRPPAATGPTATAPACRPIPGTFANFNNYRHVRLFSGSGSVTTIDLTTANPSLAALSFSGTNYTLTGGSLTMNSSTGTASVTVGGGTQSIASAVQIAGRKPGRRRIQQRRAGYFRQHLGRWQSGDR